MPHKNYLPPDLRKRDTAGNEPCRRLAIGDTWTYIRKGVWVIEPHGEVKVGDRIVKQFAGMSSKHVFEVSGISYHNDSELTVSYTTRFVGEAA